jgi:hypothetical protein
MEHRVQTASGLEYITKNYSSCDRLLLVNAPVVESRYQWVRWNQPLDLLKFSSFLKTHVGCDVKLYDFMLPINNKVLRTANKPDNEIVANGHHFSLWRYGRSDADFSKWLEEITPTWQPTAIWASTLTSYWWKGVANTVARLKNRFRDIPVILYGRYPRLEPAHAQEHCFADVMITDELALLDYDADFSIYGAETPSFCGLDIRSSSWHKEATESFQNGIGNFVFFNDPLIANQEEFSDSLSSFLGLTLKKKNLRAKFYGLCGLHPCDFSPKVAGLMRQIGFTELHFEYETENTELKLESYKQVKASLKQAGYDLQPDQVSGFVCIGLPNDDLARTIKHVLNLFEVFGSVILKPWSPTPGSDLYERYKDRIDADQIELLSPHLFPFSVVNGITPKEYEELYVLVAALNQKVRSRGFDCFPGTLAYEMISSSLKREIWSLPL